MPGAIRTGPDHTKRYPESDRLSTEATVNLLRAGAHVHAQIAGLLRAHGLTPGGFNALMILDGADGALCPHEIGERLVVTRGTVTGVLDTLEKAGLVQRGAHPEDRRMIQVTMTPDAKKRLAAALHDLFPTERRIMSPLTDREKDTLVRLLGKVLANLGSPNL